MHILVVEDEKALCDTIARSLRRLAYSVDCCYDGQSAAEMLAVERFDLVVLDLNLPGEDGMTVLRTLRERDRDTKVLILSARCEVADKVAGLDAGANDYLTKPFNILELKARVRALLRRTGMTSAGEHTVGELYVCRDKHIVRVSGQDVPLTNKEFSLLCLLLEHSGAALTRDRIMDSVWGSGFDGENRTVDVHVRTLRTKLGAAGAYIETVRGVGYRFTPEKGSAP